MKVYMISHAEMEMLDSIRHWLSEIINKQKLAKSQQHTAADFANAHHSGGIQTRPTGAAATRCNSWRNLGSSCT